jgi:xanthine dehydrogenase small subunit
VSEPSLSWSATVDGREVEVALEAGESLLLVLRERLGLTSVKDGCAPQGQCGCCTVLIDGAPRVACVTPAARVAGRAITTIDGLDATTRGRLVDAFLAVGASQCGFCTPGIVTRLAPLCAEGVRPQRVAIDRALAAHLCRCTGWQTIVEALATELPPAAELHPAAARRAELEGGVPQDVGPATIAGHGGFADDTAPPGCLVAVPAPTSTTDGTVEAAGGRWVVAESLGAARLAAGKVQGRRTTLGVRPPLPVPEIPAGGVALATSWVEPAYLEPDASWCLPGGEPASPLANGGAFGAKLASLAPEAARVLADRHDRPVRVVFAREDVVRLGAKRPPMAATAVLDGDVVRISGAFAAASPPPVAPTPYRLEVVGPWESVTCPGPPTSWALRAAGWAEQAVLIEGALHAAGAMRADLLDEGARAVLLDTCVVAPSGALAGAAVHLDATGAITDVRARVDAGDPLDITTLRSYCIGAVHQAIGWVLTEGLTVDPDTGEVHDLTIRSFGIVRARDMPTVHVEIVDSQRPPTAGASDALFAATAAALWNAMADAAGSHPSAFPALDTPSSRRLRRA